MNKVDNPNESKQVNLSLIRQMIKENESATYVEIAAETKISAPTVRGILSEMFENNELVKVEEETSIGFRKVIRYKLNKDRFYGAAFCLGSENIHYVTVNILGEIKQWGILTIEGSPSDTVCRFLDRTLAQMDVKSIGFGVPGTVRGMGYIQKNSQGFFESYPVGELISTRYGLPITLENDLNAVALGFARCYLREHPQENRQKINMVYLYFEVGCLTAGCLVDGKIIHGWNNFVGDLGTFPVEDGKTLDDLFASPLTDEQYSGIVARVITGICCLLNPQYITLGGVGFRKSCLPLITECFSKTLPDEMSPEILHASDVWHDYLEGMAELTSQQILEGALITGHKDETKGTASQNSVKQ